MKLRPFLVLSLLTSKTEDPESFLLYRGFTNDFLFGFWLSVARLYLEDWEVMLWRLCLESERLKYFFYGCGWCVWLRSEDGVYDIDL